MGHHNLPRPAQRPRRRSLAETLLAIGETTGLSVEAGLRARELEVRGLGETAPTANALDPTEPPGQDGPDPQQERHDEIGQARAPGEDDTGPDKRT